MSNKKKISTRTNVNTEQWLYAAANDPNVSAEMFCFMMELATLGPSFSSDDIEDHFGYERGSLRGI